MLADDACKREDGSESSYDSEEERYCARLQQQQRDSQVRAAAAQQAAKLHDYRQRQQARQLVEEDVLRAKIQQGLCGSDDAPTAESRSAWNSSSWGSELQCSGPQACSLRAMQEHERRWAALEGKAAAAGQHRHSEVGRNGSSDSSSSNAVGWVAYDDIPWPPAEGRSYLAGLARVELAHAAAQAQQPSSRRGSGSNFSPGRELGGQQRSDRAARRAYAKACLRYHPDKFQHRWGRLLKEGDRERVVARVQAVAQSINQGWSGMQEERRVEEDDASN